MLYPCVVCGKETAGTVTINHADQPVCVQCYVSHKLVTYLLAHDEEYVTWFEEKWGISVVRDVDGKVVVCNEIV